MASVSPAEIGSGMQLQGTSPQAHAPGGPPVWLTSFVGRQAELARIGELLRGTRVLTLTGAGGSGKTRLAAHLVGAELVRFADGIRWVDLAPIADPAQVVEQVAAAAGVVMRPGAGAVRLLASQLADRSLLLCFDNCEHVLGAVADLSGELLVSCPGMSVLATSREPLRLQGGDGMDRSDPVCGRRGRVVPGARTPGAARFRC